MQCLGMATRSHKDKCLTLLQSRSYMIFLQNRMTDSINLTFQILRIRVSSRERRDERKCHVYEKEMHVTCLKNHEKYFIDFSSHTLYLDYKPWGWSLRLPHRQNHFIRIPVYLILDSKS